MLNVTDTSYRGRFAPSPTGPLHFGSLIAAVGSYLQARRHRGSWLVRIEDVDTTRRVPGAADDILKTLEAFGFQWDQEVIFQSQRQNEYRQALEQLYALKRVYPCTCSRKQIQAKAQPGVAGPIYPGTCRSSVDTDEPKYALRLRTEAVDIQINDAIQGNYCLNILKEIGDYVIKRRDKLFAYQLAVVVDDAQQGINEVVRGSDILDSTPQQVYLQQLLGYSQPAYVHLPVAVDESGSKLSKSSSAPAININTPVPALYEALKFLGQKPPEELYHATLSDFWSWAESNWQLNNVSNKRSIVYRTG